MLLLPIAKNVFPNRYRLIVGNICMYFFVFFYILFSLFSFLFVHTILNLPKFICVGTSLRSIYTLLALCAIINPTFGFNLVCTNSNKYKLCLQKILVVRVTKNTVFPVATFRRSIIVPTLTSMYGCRTFVSTLVLW